MHTVNNVVDLAALTKALAQFYAEYDYQPWLSTLTQRCAAHFNAQRYGDLPSWLATLDKIQQLPPSGAGDDLNQALIQIGADDLSPAQKHALKQSLLQLAPWRKGGFLARGVHVDAEWQSGQKWARLGGLNLRAKRVLDVGCGNGYYALRMLGAGAAHVLGIDPSPRFVVQFAALKSLMAKPANAQILPIGIEELPERMPWFDVVFSMGVLYHRRAPIEHLLTLKNKLQQGGQLLLETLVIEGDANQILVPRGRYAMMRNVWFIPSVAALEVWLARVGFVNIRVLDVSATSCEEQRCTEFMQFQSLANFLDPQDERKTIEGYPAPLRAMLWAEVP